MKLWLITILLLFGAPQTTQQTDKAIERIAKVERFAFGPTGFTGVISSGEQDFKVILSGNSALADFEKLYSEGNIQARSYALVGIRKLNRERFNALVLTLPNSNEKVATMRGCISSKERLGDIIKQIDSGKYGR